ncbi:MAG: hemin receptor [Planctomycetota bacterium]|nr:MAG: hemin receptor [Planctomycetota bacterium]
MDEAFIQRLESSFNLIAPRGEELVQRFYTNLFARYPQVRGMFPQDMSQQRKKLLASIVLVVRSLRDPERLQNALEEMGRRHHDYGTKPEHYPLVRDTLLDVMAEIAGDAWNDQLQADWTAALNHVAGVMIDAQKQAAAASA